MHDRGRGGWCLGQAERTPSDEGYLKYCFRNRCMIGAVVGGVWGVETTPSDNGYLKCGFRSMLMIGAGVGSVCGGGDNALG